MVSLVPVLVGPDFLEVSPGDWKSSCPNPLSESYKRLTGVLRPHLPRRPSCCWFAVSSLSSSPSASRLSHSRTVSRLTRGTSWQTTRPMRTSWHSTLLHTTDTWSRETSSRCLTRTVTTSMKGFDLKGSLISDVLHFDYI